MSQVPVVVLAGQSNADFGGTDDRIVERLLATGNAFEFVKVSKGGTSLFSNPDDDWDPNNNELLATLVNQVNAAIANVRAQGDEPVVTLLWVQGEADIGRSANDYAAKLSQLIARFRNDTSSNDARVYLSLLPYASTVRSAQLSVAGSVVGVGKVDPVNAGTWDGYHYDKPTREGVANAFIDQSGIVAGSIPGYHNLLAPTTVTTPGGDFDVRVIGAQYTDVTFVGDDRSYWIDTFSGDDTIVTGAGSDLISTGDNEDRIYSGGGNDFIYAGQHDDYVDAGDGDDTLFGEWGSDTLIGGAGNDTIWAGTQDDHTEGGAGNDLLEGEDGNDFLDGGTGDDNLVGCSGSDTLTGGAGSDTFGGAAADLNGDRITDLAVGDRIDVTDMPLAGFSFNRQGGTLRIAPGDSLAIGTPNVRLVLAASLSGGTDLVAANRFTGLADFDGDGHSDLLWRNGGGTFSTWGVSGNSAGNRFAVNKVIDSSVDPTWRIQETFDFDGDGRSDILWRKGDSGEFAVWEGRDGGFAANSYYQAGVGTNWQVAGLGDLNGDGKDDIVWREGSGAFSTWQSTGTGFNVNVDLDTSVSPDWQIVGLGDFDGDGRDDLLWRNQQSGAFSTWTSNGIGFTANTNVVNSVDTTWHIDGIADFNGDGRDDILWRHDGDGAFSVWQANASGGFTANTYLDTSVAPVWQVQTTGDYNDDGKADILWRNTASGDFSIWQSNGNGFDPNTAYVSGVDTNWQVQGHSFAYG